MNTHIVVVTAVNGGEFGNPVMFASSDRALEYAHLAAMMLPAGYEVHIGEMDFRTTLDSKHY